VSLNALSDKDQAQIASIRTTEVMLQDILSPYTGENRVSADHTGTFHNGCGTDTTRPEPTQASGRVETPDQFLTSIEDRAGNSAWRILEEHPCAVEEEGRNCSPFEKVAEAQ